MKLKKKKELFSFFVIYFKLFQVLNIFVPFVKIRRNKIVLCAYSGLGYSCNPKYIAEELLVTSEKYQLVWLVDRRAINKVNQFPESIKLVKYPSIRAFFELASARIWIDNQRKSYYPVKRKSQFYFQTWHGNIALKKIENDAAQGLSEKYIKIAKEDSKMIDYFISNGGQSTMFFKNSFWCKDAKILEYGSPRNDILLSDHDFTSVRNRLRLPINEKIILYAPTFRKDYKYNTYNLDYLSVFNVVKERYRGTWNFLVKLHPNLIYNIDKLEIPEWVINVSDYIDIQELLGITDILITDYSSTMFDFMFLKRPVFIYASDYDLYKKDRDVYFPLSNTPFSISENTMQLIANIKSFDLEAQSQAIEQFIKYIGCCENGNASELVVKKIESLIRVCP
jgi:CDP-glycerol glycerophosphotransferase